MPQYSNVAIAVGPTAARKPLKVDASNIVETATAGGKAPAKPTSTK